MSIGDGRVVSNFIVQALKGQPITIYGDGTQTRSFCYVDDLVSGILKVAFSENNLESPVNLGNPEEHSMNELSEKILNLTSSKSSLIYRELPLDDPKQRRPDITSARTNFEWEPRITLNEGLTKTINYFEEIL
jgi:UDP-glucuronate decarboxylase